MRYGTRVGKKDENTAASITTVEVFIKAGDQATDEYCWSEMGKAIADLLSNRRGQQQMLRSTTTNNEFGL